MKALRIYSMGKKKREIQLETLCAQTFEADKCQIPKVKQSNDNAVPGSSVTSTWR